MAVKSDAEHGVYFRRSDYLGLARRSGIVIVDAAVIGLACFLAYRFWLAVVDPASSSAGPLVLAWFIFCYVYLVLIERSSIRTVGFRIFGARIVNLQGEMPGLFDMTLRFLFLFIGPIHPLVDIFWLSGDPFRQTLRDKFGGTLVVSIHATPIGSAPINYISYDILTMNMLFREVTIPTSSDADRDR